MKILAALKNLLQTQKQAAVKTIDDYKQEVLVRQGRIQFEKLIQKGIRIPVVFL